MLKTTSISKTKPNETKAWFRTTFTLSGQKTDCAYSTTPAAIVEENQLIRVKIEYHNLDRFSLMRSRIKWSMDSTIIMANF